MNDTAKAPEADSVQAALQRWHGEQELRKLRLTPDGDIHPDERLRMLAEVRGIVHSYDEELLGELVLEFDRHSFTVSIETRAPRCDHCGVRMDRNPYGYLCPKCSWSYDAPPDE